MEEGRKERREGKKGRDRMGGARPTKYLGLEPP